MPTLTPTEVRVLGSLIEKQITTPEYYPLTLNALTMACNQKNNRNPVTTLSEGEVEQALDSLREKNLAYVFHGSTSRVPKFKHVMPEIFQLNPTELAVMCALMLSGAQTVGEIRGRGARLHEFSGLDEVEDTLDALSTKNSEPLVTKLPRQAGQKEVRYAHLLCGEINIEQMLTEPAESKAAHRSPRVNDSERIAGLQERVARLSAEVESLRRQFEEFKKQFE